MQCMRTCGLFWNCTSCSGINRLILSTDVNPASRFVSRFCREVYWKEKAKQSIHDALSPWMLACTVENHSRWWIPECLWAWYCDWMLRWCVPQVLSSNIHLLSRLSRKVRIVAPHYNTVALTFLILCESRVILASIRNRGQCPCPHCTMDLSKSHLLGMKMDRNDRIKLACVDDQRHRSIISAAREAIYNRNYAVDSAPVERLLKPHSLVPTSVRQSIYQLKLFLFML
jgi:hypothetical protein